MVIHTDRPQENAALLGHFFARGGTALDTAYVYGGGQSEPAVGRWMRENGMRDSTFLIVKGVCTTQATPDIVTREMFRSLDRLGTDHADLYLMHRDNPEVPVAEFVDCLHAHRQAGRMRAFGGSNWTAARLQEANEYAAARGKSGFTASSPNFSLAHWNEPMWEDCVSAVGAQERAWYALSRMPLLAWSSQASGFFTGRFQPADAGTAEAADVARVWFNPENWERRRRAEILAARYGVQALHIALAYVLCQPLETYALIGPQNPAELDSSARALGVVLSQQELRWLDLEIDVL